MWADSDPDDTTYVAVIAASLRQTQTWRSQYEHAKTLAAQRGSPPVGSHSATQPSVATDAALTGEMRTWRLTS